MTPTHRMSAYHKDSKARTEVGAAWLNADGSITIILNPCVILTRDPDILLKLFPVDQRSGPPPTRREPEYLKPQHSDPVLSSKSDKDVPF